MLGAPPSPFVVAIVDDDPDFREIVRWLLASAGYDVRDYSTGEAFIDGHDTMAVGCSLIDLRLFGESGIDVLVKARLNGHDAPALILTGQGDIPTAVLSMQMGAFGFIEKRIANETLLANVADTCNQHKIIRQANGTALDAIRKYKCLTNREAEVYWMLTDGISSKEIAARLDISVRTVESHRNSINVKMCIRGTIDIVRSAFYLKPLFGRSAP